MIIKLTHTFSKDIMFEDINNYLHSLFSNILFNAKFDKKRKAPYSLKITRFKTYNKNKSYDIYFNSSNESVLNNLRDNASRFDIKIIKELNQQIGNLIKVTNLNYEIYDIVLKNWGIESPLIGNKKRIDYKKEFSIDLLKELIMLQTYMGLDSTLKNQITPNAVSNNNIEYYDFIDHIVMGEERRVRIKDSFVTTYDVIINVKSDKKSKTLANKIIHNGLGAKNSFALGYAEYYKL